MDVDLLRPGAVPISADTVLAFEFLLDKDLLLKHLEKPFADPSPTDLITQFHDVIGQTLRNTTNELENDVISIDAVNEMKFKHPAKNIAMKILSLKVAAYLKWNLKQIRSLPFKTQINLLQDLMYFTSEDKTVMEIPNIDDTDVKTASPPFLFALVLFHRWLLNTAMHRITSNWQLRYGNDMSPADETIICCPDNIKKTIIFLKDALDWEDIPKLLTIDCFKLPTETNDNLEFDWTKSQAVSREEFCSQINYDLGTFFFYREDYELAKLHFSNCYECFNRINDQNGFLDIDKEVLDVYIRACTFTTDTNRNLLEQMNNSIVNQFMGIIPILQQDNIQREIPLSHRINLELDIQGALSSGAFTVIRDLLSKIKALNIVRCVLDREPLYQYSVSTIRNVDTLIWAIASTWTSFSENDKCTIKHYLLESIIKDDLPELLTKIQSTQILSNLFDSKELAYMLQSETHVKVPEYVMKPEPGLFEISKKRKPKQEFKQLEKQLTSSYDYKEIKEVLIKMSMLNINANMADINPQWELPIPLQSVIKSVPRGFLQDYVYVLLAKSKEQLLSKNWNLALELLIVLDKELQSVQCNIPKLFKMINWEVLLVQITQLLEEWPNAAVDKIALANACEVCLQTNDSVLPRTEIIEACAICLLNLGRWEFLINYEKRWTTFEITSAIALGCHEIVKHKGSKKFSKNLWDIVLPVFGSLSLSQSKRGSSGFHDPNNVKNNLVYVFSKLKDSWCLTVVISLLAKLFNIFKDETSLELQVDYANLWPSVVSNSNSYNVVATSEMLSELVMQALKDYPTNVPWLRLMGDLNFANGNYKISLSYYLKSLLICYDYFNIPVRNDDHIFRRMIKSCTALGCYTQAAVLCQFVEEPDYALAFRILSDQKTCNDAVDAYYHCFWDSNILEFLIHVHNRKGEFQRRKCAVQVIGMLEVNSNNNEEIQREASNLRKSIFLKALCKQYVF